MTSLKTSILLQQVKLLPVMLAAHRSSSLSPSYWISFFNIIAFLNNFLGLNNPLFCLTLFTKCMYTQLTGDT